MSRTIKTRPLYVRMMDPKDHGVGAGELHNHDKGYCDLPERNFKAINERYEAIRNGEYEVSLRDTCEYTFVFTGVGLCACAMCSDRVERKAKARRNRRKARTALGRKAKVMRASNLHEVHDAWSDSIDEVYEPVPFEP